MADFSVIDGGLQAQNIASSPDANGSFILLRSSEHRKATFRYAGTFTPVATPTDVIMIKGSITRTLRVKRIVLGGVATANGNMLASLIRRSTFGTQGGAVFNNVTSGGHDTTDAAATGLVSVIGTANLTSVGTQVGGNLGQGRLFLPTTATGTPNPLVWEFATRQDKALIIRTTSDFVFINLNGGTVPAGGVIDYEIEIEEDQS